MAINRTSRLKYNWSEKHKEYMRNSSKCSMNIAEGSIRSGKTTDNIFCFAHDLKQSKDKLHLATASTQPTAKIIIGDCDGYGLEHIFRGQCKWGKYKGNECLKICGKDTNYQEKIVLFCGGAKADSYKKFRGMSIGLWIATEINLHHAETIREAQRRQVNADIKRFYWDLNPESPKTEIYKEFIDVYERKSKSGQLKGGFNLATFNIFDNVNLSKENLEAEISKYEVGSVFYNRDILGLRCAAEGIVFRDFAENTKKYICKREEVPQRFVSVGVGYDLGGNKSNFALVCTGITSDNKVYVLRVQEIFPEDLRLQDVENVAKEFITGVEKDYGVRVNYCYVDDNYYTTVNSLNDWRCIFDTAAHIKSTMPLEDRPLMVSKLMAQGKFKLVEGECKPLIEQLQNLVYDDKSEKAIVLDDGTTPIDLWDALNYSWANSYLYLTD
nr:MAG TPA: large terminase [Caudoviricetes sp.]